MILHIDRYLLVLNGCVITFYRRARMSSQVRITCVKEAMFTEWASEIWFHYLEKAHS